jgi:hypothetical protein
VPQSAPRPEASLFHFCVVSRRVDRLDPDPDRKIAANGICALVFTHR